MISRLKKPKMTPFQVVEKLKACGLNQSAVRFELCFDFVGEV